ncbi:MAG TPA: hypothetical protein VGL76_02590 [Gaiellaceae bacterium]
MPRPRSAIDRAAPFAVLLGLWFVLALTLSVVTARVRDWFDMTDELRYERLAVSIAHSHSLVPRIHGFDIHSFSQLYPLLLAPVFASGLVPHDLGEAHVVNAWVMSSACIPAYLLARRVSPRLWIAFATAFLAVCLPWLLYSTMLMTEVAAYPAFLWASLALQWMLWRRSPLADVVALAALALAFFARTELLVLVIVAPVAIVVYEFGEVPRRFVPSRAVRRHPVFAGAYVLVAAGAIALWQTGRLADVVGVYGVYAQNNQLVPGGFFGSFVEHLAFLALGVGIVPVVVGGGWLLATVFRGRDPATRAFASVALVAAVGVLVQATNFDVRYTGYVHDRFLLYLVPLFALAALVALTDGVDWRWSAVPTALVVAGFVWGALPAFTWSQFPQLDPDSPISKLFVPLSHVFDGLTGARTLLALAAAAALAALWVAARSRAARIVLVVIALAAPVATTSFTFAHLFDTKDWALRPITASEAGAFDWIDATIGTNANVSMLPYPVDSDYFISQQRWRDLEFWNASVTRDAQLGSNVYEYTGIWFPKTYLAIDPRTGAFEASPTRWVAVSDKESRFQIAGAVQAVNGDVELVDAGAAWRAAWTSSGLYEDGWTRPRVPARFRVYATPGQRHAEKRTLTFVMRPPDAIASAVVSLHSDASSWRGSVVNTGSLSRSITLCVPAKGSTDVVLSTPLSTSIPGDLASLAASQQARTGGIFLGAVSLASEVGGRCRA